MLTYNGKFQSLKNYITVMIENDTCKDGRRLTASEKGFFEKR